MYVRVRDALISDKILTIDLEQKTSLGDVAQLKGPDEDSESKETGKQ